MEDSEKNLEYYKGQLRQRLDELDEEPELSKCPELIEELEQIRKGAMAELEAYEESEDEALQFRALLERLEPENLIEYNWARIDNYIECAKAAEVDIEELKLKYGIDDEITDIASKRRAIEMITKFEHEIVNSEDRHGVYNECMLRFMKENITITLDKYGYENFRDIAFEEAKKALAPLKEMKLFEDQGRPICLMPFKIDKSEEELNIDESALEIAPRKITIGSKELIQKTHYIFRKHQGDIEEDYRNVNITPEVKLYMNFNEQKMKYDKFFEPCKDTPESLRVKIKESIKKGDADGAKNAYRMYQFCQLEVEVLEPTKETGKQLKWIQNSYSNYVSQMLRSKEAAEADHGFRKELIGALGCETEELDIKITKKGPSQEEYLKKISDYAKKNISGKYATLECGFRISVGNVISERIAELVERSLLEDAKHYVSFWRMSSDLENYKDEIISKKREISDKELRQKKDEAIFEYMSENNWKKYGSCSALYSKMRKNGEQK